MNARRCGPSSKKRRVSDAKDPMWCNFVDRRPPLLLCAQVRFDLLFTVWKFRASRFQKLSWHARADKCEMELDAVAPAQNAPDVLKRSPRGLTGINDNEHPQGVAMTSDGVMACSTAPIRRAGISSRSQHVPLSHRADVSLVLVIIRQPPIMPLARTCRWRSVSETAAR